jgi:hypothetical protein
LVDHSVAKLAVRSVAWSDLWWVAPRAVWTAETSAAKKAVLKAGLLVWWTAVLKVARRAAQWAADWAGCLVLQMAVLWVDCLDRTTAGARDVS